jgi:hydroxypyruvate isomerase
MNGITRRQALTTGASALVGAVPRVVTARPRAQRAVTKGRLKQSVSRWPYSKIPLPEFCRALADMGLTAIDLLEEPDWAVARKYGLICSMGYAGGGSIPDALNVKANHDAIVRNFEQMIPRAAAQKVPNVITFFGNRRGMSDAEATANCVEGLNRVKKIGEDDGVTFCVELLNSKVNHKDYQGDRTPFAVEIVKAVGSPRVKLLYDIYQRVLFGRLAGDAPLPVRKRLRGHPDLRDVQHVQQQEQHQSTHYAGVVQLLRLPACGRRRSAAGAARREGGVLIEVGSGLMSFGFRPSRTSARRSLTAGFIQRDRTHVPVRTDFQRGGAKGREP